MTYERFEDLPVWKEAVRLVETAYRLCESPVIQKRWSFRDQLERAALSVSNNIAEGFERGTTNELLAFLYIARGSAGEVRSMLSVLERLPKAEDLKSQISNLKSLAESCSRQLRAWADSLQNSNVTGQRHLNDSVREKSRKAKNIQALEKRLLETLPVNHPLRQWRESQMRSD